MKKILIINNGVGNILSVKRAFEHCGADALVSNSQEDIKKAERIIVPGVGAFNNCVSALENNNLKDSLLEFANTGRPYLGICVGMQMLLDQSEEFGVHSGLGLIKGDVTKINENGNFDVKHKIPFVGWKKLQIRSDNLLLKGVDINENFYFIHSYKANPCNEENILASYKYSDSEITAVIGKDNIYGTQFHPEKSGDAGLRVIQNFLNL